MIVGGGHGSGDEVGCLHYSQGAQMISVELVKLLLVKQEQMKNHH